MTDLTSQKKNIKGFFPPPKTNMGYQKLGVVDVYPFPCWGYFQVPAHLFWGIDEVIVDMTGCGAGIAPVF